MKHVGQVNPIQVCDFHFDFIHWRWLSFDVERNDYPTSLIGLLVETNDFDFKSFVCIVACRRAVNVSVIPLLGEVHPRRKIRFGSKRRPISEKSKQNLKYRNLSEAPEKSHKTPTSTREEKSINVLIYYLNCSITFDELQLNRSGDILLW